MMLANAIYDLEQFYMAQFQKAVSVTPNQQGPTARVQYFLQTNSENFIAGQLFNKDGAPVGEMQLQSHAQAQGGPKP